MERTRRRPGGRRRSPRQAGARGASCRCPGPGEAEKPGPGEQPPPPVDLGAPDEARQLGRQVVRGGIERPGRRERVLEPRTGQLVEAFGPRQVLEPMLAEVAQLKAVGQGAGGESPRGVGHEDWPPYPAAASRATRWSSRPGGALGGDRLAGMDAHPDPDGSPVGQLADAMRRCASAAARMAGTAPERHECASPSDRRGRRPRRARRPPRSRSRRRAPRAHSARRRAPGRAGSTPRCR